MGREIFYIDTLGMRCAVISRYVSLHSLIRKREYIIKKQQLKGEGSWA